MSALKDNPVTIIGAGVAGLTAACALAQRGARVTVLERAGALREVGAGLQISPNAVRVIAALGLWPRFEAISARSDRISTRPFCSPPLQWPSPPSAPVRTGARGH